MRLSLFVVIIAASLSAATAVAQDRPEGLWSGSAEGKPGATVSVRFHKNTGVYLDGHGVTFFNWTAKRSHEKQGKTRAADTDFHIQRRVSLKGQDRPPEKASSILGVMRWSATTLRICVTEAGGKLRPTLKPTARQNKKEKVTCLDLKQVGGDFNQCVAKCVQRNMMRAVGPDVIEADCRRSCGGH